MLKQESLVARHTICGSVSNACTLIPKLGRLTGNVRLVGPSLPHDPALRAPRKGRGPPTRRRSGRPARALRPRAASNDFRSAWQNWANAGSERSLAPDMARVASGREKAGISRDRHSISNSTALLRRSSQWRRTRAIAECRVPARRDGREVRTGDRAGLRNFGCELCALGEQRRKLPQVPALAKPVRYVARSAPHRVRQHHRMEARRNGFAIGEEAREAPVAVDKSAQLEHPGVRPRSGKGRARTPDTRR